MEWGASVSETEIDQPHGGVQLSYNVRAKMELESRRGISRMKYESTTNGWFVRYTTQGETFSKLFSDGVYGSSEKSLEAAEKYYDELRTVFPPPTWEEFLAQSGTKPKSGIVGVRRLPSKYKDKISYFWEASYRLAGKTTKRRFSINKYGEEEAKRLAISVRKEAEPELEKQYYTKYWDYRTGRRFNRSDIVDEPWAFEGAEKFVLHKAAERNREIRMLKLRSFLKQHGTLFCEVCSFSFEKTYGQIGKGLIEIHHLVPLAEMEENHRTKLEDLICICSNCHFAVHNGDPGENLNLMRTIFETESRKPRKVEQD